MKYLFYIIIFFFSCTLLHAHNSTIDSLEHVLSKDNLTIEQQCEIIHEISLKLVDVDPEKSRKYSEQHLEIAERNKLPIQIADANNIQGLLFRNSGDYNKAIGLFLKALRIYDQLKEKKHIAMTHNNIGVAHMYNEVNSEAEKSYLQALNLATEIKDTNVIKMAINNLGILACYDGQYKKGINYFNQSLDVERSLHNDKGISECMNNIGAAYYYMGVTDSALIYFHDALKTERILNDVSGIAGSLANLGQIYSELGQFDKAEELLIGSENVARENGIAAEYQDALGNLSFLYEQTGDFKKSLAYQRLFQTVRDSIHDLKKTEQIAEMQTKYETERKEKQLAEQQVELAIKESQVQRSNFQLLTMAGGLIAILLIGLIIYLRQKARQDKLKQQVALEQVEALNKVQNEKLRISRDLHDNIGSQLTFVISSLDNMNYIQDDDKRKDKLSQLGTFTRDTMSQLRETIWAIKSESITIEQLLAKVAEFIDKAKVACPDIEFRINGKGDNFKLNSNQAINVFRTIQEAVNNAIKYSEAKQIVINSETNKLVIKDNGIGFDLEKTKARNGLVNMKTRMKDVGFETNIHSSVGNGTKVSIFLT